MLARARLKRRGLRCGARILVCVGAALYAGLRFRVAVQTALHELDLALDLVEFGVCLGPVRIVRAWGGLEGRWYLTVVDRGNQNNACSAVSFMCNKVSRAATDHRAAILSCA
jgi:hypothetical protein